MFGPQDPRRSWCCGHLCKRILDGQELKIFGDLFATTCMKDVVAANMLARTPLLRANRADSRAFNGSGIGTSVLQLVDTPSG